MFGGGKSQERFLLAHRDGRHVSISVVSPLFEGQNAVKRQRMVYKVTFPWAILRKGGYLEMI